MKDLEREEYEKGWGQCARCGVRRPLSQLGRELELGLTILSCLDSRWCEHNRRDRQQHAKLAALKKACSATPDCPRPREKGSSLCAQHRRRR